MPIPGKFRGLVDRAEASAPVPDYIWMSFAICVMDDSACGWGGWIIESAWKDSSQTGQEATPLSAADNQKCPICGRPTFRTAVEKRFLLDATNPEKITYPYKTVPIDYSEE